MAVGCFFGGGRTTLDCEAAAFVTTGFAEDFVVAVGFEARGALDHCLSFWLGDQRKQQQEPLLALALAKTWESSPQPA